MPEFHFVGAATLIGMSLDGVESTLRECAEDLVSEAQAAAPVDTGTLRASIQAGDVEGGGSEMSIKVFTGGESSGYAVFQHEGTSRGVPATKFLEGPLIANRGVYLEALSRAMKGTF